MLMYALLLFLFFVFFPTSHCWIVFPPSPLRTCSWRLYSTPEETFFDDFDGQIIGGDTGSRIQSTALQQRIQTIQQQELQKDARTLKNWKTGNWNVRGFSLDDTADSSIPSKVIPASSENTCIWVGRTDGSVLKVQLGTEYWASFRSNAAVVRDSDDDDTMSRPEQEPFLILQQFSTDSGQVNHLLEYEDKYLFTVTAQASENIQQWLLHEDDRSPLLCKTFQGAHNGDIVAVKLLSRTSILLSVAQDGSIALWDVETGDIVYNCVMEGASAVQCADSDEHSVYLGTADGKVVAYQVMDLLEMASTGRDTCPMPHGQWTACDNGAITSISCGGPGTLGRGRVDQSTYLLLTGDENGGIKQWEILPRKVDGSARLEQWPKLATQRLAKKAHVFRGHQGAVTALRAVDATKFVSSGADGTVRAWNPVSGKELFLMDGFDDPVKSLCFLGELLITDGMKKFVCVHDFGINPEEESYDADFYLDNL